MKSKVLSIISFIPLVVTALVLQILPDKLPAHYDLYGNITRWGSKFEELIFPILIIIIAFVWQFIISCYRNKIKSYDTVKIISDTESNCKALTLTANIMIILFSILQYIFLYLSYSKTKDSLVTVQLDIYQMTNIILGIFYIIIGAILPKVHRNSLLGIRTKWSLSSDKIWKDTNRFGSTVTIIIGLITIVSALLFNGIISLVIMVILVLIDTAIVSIYSFKKYKEDKGHTT